jgi:hypothetical protein
LIVVCGSAVLGTALWRARSRSRRDEPQQLAERTDGTVADIDRLEKTVQLLQRQLLATQALVADLYRASAQGTRPSPAIASTPAATPKANEELHQAMRDQLGRLLSQSPASPETQTIAASLRAQLATALGSAARVTEARCGAEFCRVRIEHDDPRSQEDVGVTAAALPLFQREILFTYDNDARSRVTTLFVAREGASLPLGDNDPAQVNR